MAEAGALERAHIRGQLIRHLAAGGKTKTQLGKQYGVTHQAISAFASRHAVEISQVHARLQDKLDDEFAHLWAADKVNRIATLQDQVEQVADLMADPERAANAGVQAAEMYRTAQTALRGIAEELGQLPQRSTVQHEGGVSVRYELVNVQLGDLT